MKTNTILTAFVIGLIAFGIYVVHECPERNEANLFNKLQADNVISEIAVVIKSNNFYPDIITIKVGQKVTWTDDDAKIHTIVFDDGDVAAIGTTDNIDLLAEGGQFSMQFTKPGDFTYHSGSLPSMRGRVVVVE